MKPKGRGRPASGDSEAAKFAGLVLRELSNLLADPSEGGARLDDCLIIDENSFTKQGDRYGSAARSYAAPINRMRVACRMSFGSTV